jgi:hypothetical protein
VKGNRRRVRLPDGRIIDAMYRKPELEEYPPGYEHQVVITESTRHGRAKRHTFARRFPEATGPGKWRPETPGSLKELDDLHRQGFGTQDKPMPVTAWGAQRQQSLGVPINKPLKPDTVVHLTDGVDLPAAVLAVVLEALVSQARHQIDLADIKVIVSQLGSRIAQLDTLTAEQRRLAESALYTEILGRCTTIGPVSND